MSNQYTTVERVRRVIGEENYVADFCYDARKKHFRLVYRSSANGVDTLVYFSSSGFIGKLGYTHYSAFDGRADFNRRASHGGVHFDMRYQLVDDDGLVSVFDIATQFLSTYAERYSRPAYFNADGSTMCKYTQEQLDWSSRKCL